MLVQTSGFQHDVFQATPSSRIYTINSSGMKYKAVVLSGRQIFGIGTAWVTHDGDGYSLSER